MHFRVLLPFLLSGFLPGLSAQSHEAREFTMVANGDTTVMKRYVMCIYLRGEKAADFDQDALAKLQAAHLSHIDSLAEKGHVLVAGPFGDNGTKRGILILDAGDNETAIPWVEADPMVKAGRLAYELHPWWTAKQGSFR
jgi:uncharacterized protein